MNTKLLLAFVAVLFAAMFASCSKDDGDWDPMKWSTDVKTASDGYVEVPAEGGTYVFTCKNYPGFWLSDAVETIGTNETIYYAHDDDNTWNDITSAWTTVKASDGKLIVTIMPNATNSGREFTVSVTAGDIFDTFRFRQSATPKQYTMNDIVWKEDCPYDIYKIYPRGGTEQVELYSGIKTEFHSVWLERNTFSPSDKFYNNIMYMTTSALVADSVSEDAAYRVPNLRHIYTSSDDTTKSFNIDDILTYGELNYMCNEAPIGTKMTFGLYLLNPEQKALQKIDVTFVKVEKPQE